MTPKTPFKPNDLNWNICILSQRVGEIDPIKGVTNLFEGHVLKEVRLWASGL